jgi:spore coat-associated protein N
MSRHAYPAARAPFGRRGFFVPVLTAAVLTAVTGSMIANGAHGVLTDTDSSSLTVGAGAIELVWTDSEHTDHTELTQAIDLVRPADTVQSVADLVNTGSLEITNVQLSVGGINTGTVSDGVQLAMDRCSLPWTGTGTGSGSGSGSEDSEFTCAGTMTVVSVDRPAAGVISLDSSPVAAPQGIDHLRFSFRLPDSAPASAQGTSGTVTFTVTGSQVTGRHG